MFASKDLYFSKPSGYQISRSVRTRASASAYLNRTPASASNRQTWTWSGWVKRGALGAQTYLFGTNPGSSATYIRFESNDTLTFYTFSGSYLFQLSTTQVFRDPSAWYHFVFVLDTTNATASNRARIYLNGLQITALSTASYPSLNASYDVNTVNIHTLMAYYGPSNYTDGYLTEINFIDGQALTPSSFGQTSTIGVWQPIKYTGTYGTNGFYLNFSDNSAATSAAIGKDYSGNGNNWTPNNISVTAGVTYDSMLDVPTMWADGGNGRGNYAVLNPLKTDSTMPLSEGNLKVAGTSSAGYATTLGSIGVTSGKWYWEITIGSAALANALGIAKATTSLTNWLGNDSASYGYFASGNYYAASSGTLTNTYASFTTNDVISVALDLDNGTLQFYKNNVAQGSATTGVSGEFFPAVCDGQNGSVPTLTANFGQRPFTYTPPTGFVALNTQNLPNPTISNGANYMAATTYTGNGTSQSISNAVNGVSFQPDFVWIKSRSGTNSHWLVDAIRGVSNGLISNSTNAEQTLGLVTAFNSNGFSVAQVSTNDTTNGNAMSLVGWNWKAGGSSSSNTNGSITSTVSVGTTQGFSVVTYTGTGANATVGHGLGVAPKMIIVKNRSGVFNWAVYFYSIGAGNVLGLNQTSASSAGPTYFNSTDPTSTVFSVGSAGNTNGSTNSMVAYCFSAVAGYSAFGSYTGNGSTDGPFIFTGFRPRFILIKVYSGITDDWYIFDSSRNTYNVSNLVLFADLSNAEATATTSLIDFVSNGFKIRGNSNGINGSTSYSYIYAAFAENPFKNSLAR